MKKALVVLCTLLFAALPLIAAENLATIISQAKANYEKFCKDVQDLSYTEITQRNGSPTYKTCFWKNGMARIGAPGTAPVDLWDGHACWRLDTPGVKAMTDTGFDGLAMSFDAKTWFTMVPGDAKLDEKKAKVGDRECYVIRSMREDGSPGTVIAVNAATLDLVEYKNIGEEEDITQSYSEWKEIAGGWEIPTLKTITDEFKSDRPADRSIAYTFYTITDVMVNRGFSDALFDPAKVPAETGAK